ncbi:hypothetical protein VSR34_21705 [Paraburkholderia sp. JHI2823]
MNLKRMKAAGPLAWARPLSKPVVLWLALAGLISATPFALYGLGVRTASD